MAKSKGAGRGKPHAGKALGKKRKARPLGAAAAAPPATAAAQGGKGGDDDDFEYLLDEMPAAATGSDSDGDAAAAAADGDEAEGEPADSGEEGQEVAEEQAQKKKKKRRRKGQKPSAVEFEASREMAAEIADAGAADQADWLWHSFQQCTGAGSLEREGLTASCLVELPQEGTLEQRLQALEPRWRERFCNNNAAGGKGGGGGGNSGEKGAPSLLLVSPAAMGAIKLIKHCPQFHQACRIAKLFAKHIKVPEQQELLAKNVVCVAAGTPNRIAKLAELEALKLGSLRYVILDTSLDAKQRTILDIPETRADWWELFSKHLRPRLVAGHTRLALVNSDRLA